jgi:hypothetical protein
LDGDSLGETEGDLLGLRETDADVDGDRLGLIDGEAEAIGVVTLRYKYCPVAPPPTAPALAVRTVSLFGTISA